MIAPHIHISRRIVGAFAGLVLACMLGTSFALALRPPRLYTHFDTITYTLRQHGISYRRVTAEQPWPDSVNYYAYGAAVYPFNLNVTVELRDTTMVAGRVECKNDKYRCELTIADLGIERQPLPDIVERYSWPLLDWLEQAIRSFKM